MIQSHGLIYRSKLINDTESRLDIQSKLSNDTESRLNIQKQVK